MNTLLLRLSSPMQSWGVEAKFNRRTTERAPTKSGVIGMVAAALGRRRNEDISDLAALRFGVRTDSGGTLLRDFHTAKSECSSYVTDRYYLCDAVFLAGLEGNAALLHKIDEALGRPVFPLFLGRRSCPPEGRVSLGVRENTPLEQALADEPFLGKMRGGAPDSLKLRTTVETTNMTKRAYFIRDVPVSFDQQHRMFGFRRVNEYTAPCGAPPEKPTLHDPMAELEE